MVITPWECHSNLEDKRIISAFSKTDIIINPAKIASSQSEVQFQTSYLSKNRIRINNKDGFQHVRQHLHQVRGAGAIDMSQSHECGVEEHLLAQEDHFPLQEDFLYPFFVPCHILLMSMHKEYMCNTWETQCSWQETQWGQLKIRKCGRETYVKSVPSGKITSQIGSAGSLKLSK
jgi:hypothetical protein